MCEILIYYLDFILVEQGVFLYYFLFISIVIEMAKEVKASQKKQYKKTQPVRLYAKGVFTGFRRARMNQYEG